MEEITLYASERPIKSGKFKEPGFIPGVLYGDNIQEAISVKFDESNLRKTISRHGAHAKVWIQYNNSKKFGFIKDLQKHPVSHKLLHIDVQLVSRDHEVKMQLPIVFKGEDGLRNKQLLLHVHKAAVDVVGKVDSMPDAITVDVSNKEQGDTITSNDFDLNQEIKITTDEEVYGTISVLKTQTLEELTEDAALEANEAPTEVESID